VARIAGKWKEGRELQRGKHCAREETDTLSAFRRVWVLAGRRRNMGKRNKVILRRRRKSRPLKTQMSFRGAPSDEKGEGYGLRRFW